MKNISYWQKTTNLLLLPKINQNLNIDIAIIGGGITGIMCAYYLRNSGKKIAVFVQGTIGCQTTGHTTAKISYLHKTIYQFLIHYYNTEIAHLYLESNKQAMEDIENIIKEEKIECDYQKNNAFIYTKHQSNSKYIKKEIEALQKLGVKTIVNQHKDKSILNSVGVDNQAVFHLLKYIYAIVEKCRESGITIYENSKAIDFDIQKNRTIFKCNDYTVSSKQTVFATRYPQINFPETYFLKLSQTREVALHNYINNQENDSLLSIDNPNESFRPTQNGMIYAGYAFDVGSKIKDITIFDNNKQLFGKREIDYWAAQDAKTNRGIPYIGYFSSKYDHCYVACGYNKWGMTLSHVSARLLSDMILHKENPYQTLYSPSYGNFNVSIRAIGKLTKSSIKGMIINRFAPFHIDLKKGEGKVVRNGFKLLAIYKDEKGKIHICKAQCRHLKCIVSFNALEKTWDCPCHGSRYDVDGKLIEGPAVSSLRKVRIKRNNKE
ncbi:MAG: FAD-dependent oxidoreductase [Coprobacillaceae bacterium]